MCFVFFVVANTKDSGKWKGAPCLACCKARKNKTGGDFAKAVIVGETCEFVELRGVVCCDLACPEGTPKDCGVEDVNCGVVDGTFGRVTYSEGYRQSHRQESNLVGGGWRQCVSEGGGGGDVAYRECGS